MIPDNQDAIVNVEFWAGGIPPATPGAVAFNSKKVTMEVVLRFFDAVDKDKAALEWLIDKDKFTFTFRGWKSLITGNGMKRPIKAGTILVGTTSVPFGFLFASYYV